jgi:hypothetical protein
MKTMTSKMKPESFKSKEQIDSLIEEMSISSEINSEIAEFTPVPSSSRALVSDDYYRGKLFPMISHYLPDAIELTEEEKTIITKGVQRKLTGLSANMPITCYGDSCPFKASCPLHQIDKAPVGENCPIEAMVMDLYTKRYLDEFAVEAANFSEVTTMSMLAATHIMEMRGFMAIGRDDDNSCPDGIIKNVVGFTPDEDPITQYQEHPGYAIIERAWKWRSKLLESLGATRKDKIKLGLGADDGIVSSLSEANSSLRAKIEKLTIVNV